MAAEHEGIEEREPGTRELRLLLACARAAIAPQEEAAVRQLLQESPDWTAFAQAAVERGFAVIAARTLLKAAPNLVPEDIQEAFRTLLENGRSEVRALLDDLGMLSRALAGAGIEAIALDSSPFARSASGDSPARITDHAGILVRDSDLAAASALLRGSGYEERAGASAASTSRTYSKAGCHIDLATSLASGELGIEIDPVRLWRAARRGEIAGTQMLALAPEDGLARLAVTGGREAACNFAWAFEVAAFVAAHPTLDWAALVERARSENWLRMLVLAMTQVRRHALIRLPEGWTAAERLLAGEPDDARIWRQLAELFFRAQRYGESVACCDVTLAHEPDDLRAWAHRRAALRALGRRIDWDLPAEPNDAGAWALRAGLLWWCGRFERASEASDRVLSLDPDHVGAARLGIHCRLHCCDWSRRADDQRRIREGLSAHRLMIKVFDHRNLCDSEAELRASSHLVACSIRAPKAQRAQRAAYRHDRIRIAYLSPDFRQHPVGSLIVGCLERHDRARFETMGVSVGPNDGSALRLRIEEACDSFLEAQQMRDAQVAALLVEAEIDIAIDLCGYAGGYRAGILANRPAALQVNYLGFPGTMSASFIDYMIADATVIPAENTAHYSEKIAYLPHCYLPTDEARRIAEKVPSRLQAGLPETGFVYACFNTTHKIGPEIFGVWMRLLNATPGSVLWLAAASAEVMSHLHREAVARGVAPDRVIFAQRISKPDEHLARLAVADLFLDTLPYNAHASACDALWAGLPVLTCIGSAFAGRVAASALAAAGLPELAVASLTEYERLAQMLAEDSGRLASIKSQLRQSRESAPLFDTSRYTRNLETALATMWERAQAGLPPASFTVSETAREERPWHRAGTNRAR